MDKFIAEEVYVPELDIYADVTVAPFFEYEYVDGKGLCLVLNFKAVNALDRLTCEEIDVKLLDTKELDAAIKRIAKNF